MKYKWSYEMWVIDAYFTNIGDEQLLFRPIT